MLRFALVILGLYAILAATANKCSDGENNDVDGETTCVEGSNKLLEPWTIYGCDKIFAAPRPIHNQSTWMLLRGAYQGTVGRDSSSIAELSHVNGFDVPIHLRSLAEKGRGVFATETIAKGQLVWSGKQTATFSDGAHYVHFLDSIPEDLACDVVQWAFVGNDENSIPIIHVDLDEGSCMNSAWDTEVENVGSLEGSDGYSLYALNDIKAGEEILCDYGAFADPYGWEQFGIHF